MKLPPLALTAPSLCPRCDAPALFVEECKQCALPIRQCGSCLGVAGPFDRYCGFCGHELVLGTRRSGIRRLWLLAGLLPIAAGLAIGLSPVGQQALHGGAGRNAGATVRPTLTDHKVGFSAVAPQGWSVQDLTHGGQPLTALFSDPADAPVAASSPGALLSTQPKGVVVEIARPSIADPGVDSTDPLAVLAFESAQVLAAPPAGYSVSTVTPVRAETVGGRRAAKSVVSLVGPGASMFVFEKVYISAPGGGLLLVEALGPTAELPRIDAFVNSITLTR